MVTRVEQRLAGVAAAGTAIALTAGLVIFGGGPPNRHDGVVLDWFEANAGTVRLSALVWLGAAVAMVVFAVAVREAIWATIIDRNWAAMLFVQGAVGFAAVSVVAAGLLWALADQAAAGAISAEMAGSLWWVDRTLWRFATWGLTVPLLVVGLVLHRYSTLGQFGAVTSVLVAAALLVPATWAPGLYAFAAWLVLAGVTFARPRLRRREEVPTTEFAD